VFRVYERRLSTFCEFGRPSPLPAIVVKEATVKPQDMDDSYSMVFAFSSIVVNIDISNNR